MYPSTAPTAWNSSAPPASQQATQSPQQSAAQHPQQPPPPAQQQQQQHPPPPQHQPQQWAMQPNGQYMPRPPQQMPQVGAPMQPQPGPPAMPMQPHPQHDYRSLPPLYPPPFSQQAPPMYPPQQPAPRQRTAIACRYCRRRKIRCSGFDQSEDGRCTNCQRFSQECVFTPVSAQTQAFVPAHTAFGRGPLPPNTQIYGAYGQRLPSDAYAQPGQQQPPPPGAPQQPGQYPPPYSYPPQAPPPNGAIAGVKRGSDEPHTPTLPPTAPGGYVYPPESHGLAQRPVDQFPALVAGLTQQDASSRHQERIRLGEIKDADTQTDPVTIQDKIDQQP